MTGDGAGQSGGSYHGSLGEPSATRYVLLSGNRLLVAAGLTTAVFVAFVAAASGVEPTFIERVVAGDVIETIFATMLTVVVTGATLVVTIGQLVLTQENGPLGDQRERMAGAMDAREEIGAVIGGPSPAAPATFLDELLAAAIERAERFDAAMDGTDDEALRAAVDEFTDGVVTCAEPVRAQLDGAQFGSFDVVGGALAFEYGAKIHRLELLRDEYDDELAPDQLALLEDLHQVLSLFGPAREHVKTLYFQWALIDLSRLILYAAVPAIAVSGAMLAGVGTAGVPGSTLGVDHLVLVVGGAFAVTLVPFMVFVAYLLRILTVAKRTLAIEPLTLRPSDREEI